MLSNEHMNVFLDTDIGSDIDDAVALAYLLAHPDCRLMGITTVSGEADARARIASAVCRNVGRDVPIFPGASDPLLVPQLQPRAPQADALSRWDHRPRFARGEAIEFMRHVIRAHARNITLLAIGPLTNVALLFKVDPDIPFLLGGLVIMGGRYFGRGKPEWNIRLDPHAAEIVFHSGVDVHRCVGLDVTETLTMPASRVREQFAAPVLRPVRDFAEVWFREHETITFHDPLAAVAALDPKVCAFERGDVTVGMGDGDDRGATRFEASPAGKHEAALRVDADRFFTGFFDVVNGAPFV